MTNEDKLFIVRKVIDKGWSFEDMKYSDDLYDEPEVADEIWEMVTECKRIGTDEYFKD